MPITPSQISLNPMSAAGDILTSNGSSRIRLATGTSGQILQASSTDTSGLKWVVNNNSTPSDSGTYSQIAFTVVTSTSVVQYDYVSIPSSYSDLMIAVTTRGVSSGPTGIFIYFNSSTTGVYGGTYERKTGTGSIQLGIPFTNPYLELTGGLSSPGTASTTYASGFMIINQYANTSMYKLGYGQWHHGTSSTTTQAASSNIFQWRDTSAINAVRVKFDTAVVSTDTSISIYGIRRDGQ